MRINETGVYTEITAHASADQVDRANELAAIILQQQIEHGTLLVPALAKGYVCKLPTCNDVLDSERLFCDGVCASQYRG